AGVAAVLDATHPFAARISVRSAEICAAEGVPYLRLSRRGFGRHPGWIRHADAEACAAALPPGSNVFLTVGPGSVGPFLNRSLKLWCRRIDPAPDLPGVGWIVGKPRNAVMDELAMMRDLGLTCLVTKDSGGSRAKLDAAMALGVAVHIIDRPPPAPGEETHDIARAIAFVRAHADHLR
ncbi:MAG: precorrin-6A/cobalt-precorrin-6A reductase, partial [Jannaschia sp.]